MDYFNTVANFIIISTVLLTSCPDVGTAYEIMDYKWAVDYHKYPMDYFINRLKKQQALNKIEEIEKKDSPGLNKDGEVLDGDNEEDRMPTPDTWKPIYDYENITESNKRKALLKDNKRNYVKEITYTRVPVVFVWPFLD